jgi:hypothetical protein
MPLDIHMFGRAAKTKSEDQLRSIMLDLSWQMLIENLIYLFEYHAQWFHFPKTMFAMISDGNYDDLEISRK